MQTPSDPAPAQSRPIAEPDEAAARIVRGVRRTLAAFDLVSLTEVSLKTGRRADVMAIDAKGGVTIVEVKSGVPDFRADQKWPDYLAFCDRFYFAVDEAFPTELIPENCGLMIADAYEAAVVREPAERPLDPARRRAVLLRFARTAAQRLHRVDDPGLPL